MTAALDIVDLDVDLARRPVLRSVNLRVDNGEFVAVLGPNGAGKTTLARSILGLVPARSGSVRVGGRVPNRARSSIGFVPQRHEFAWDFPITVADAVLTGRSALISRLRRPRAADYRASARALDRVGLGPLADRPVGELSGGQRQRVLVARALALEPSLLLLDEPFTGLDVPAQEELTDLFQQLASEEHALIMTTHDIAGALTDCSRLVLMNQTIIADGPPASVADPQLWIRTFQLRPDNPLLRVVEAAVPPEALRTEFATAGA